MERSDSSIPLITVTNNLPFVASLIAEVITIFLVLPVRSDEEQSEELATPSLATETVGTRRESLAPHPNPFTIGFSHRRSSIRSSKSSIRFSTPSPPLHYLEAFLDTSLTSPTPTHMNDFSAQPAQGADNDDPSCDPVSSSLWFHVNTWVMSFVWLPRLVTSHPDYPLDEDTFINKVDIWWKVRGGGGAKDGRSEATVTHRLL